MNLIIREVCPADAPAIAGLNKSAMGYDFSPKATGERLERLLHQEGHKIFVAVADGTVLGYVHACDYDLLYAPHCKNIMGLAVDAGCRQMGLGRKLLGAVEAWAKTTGAAAVRLSSGAARADAHAFYRACGYTGAKEQKTFSKAL